MVPVVSAVLMGVPPPSRTRMKCVRSALYTYEKVSSVEVASLSRYDTKTLNGAVALFVLKSCDVIVNVSVPKSTAEYGWRL